jgi:hypothetical protein
VDPWREGRVQCIAAPEPETIVFLILSLALEHDIEACLVNTYSTIRRFALNISLRDLAFLDPVGQPFGCASQIIVSGLDELRYLFWIIFGERCEQQAFLREVKIVGGAQGLDGYVLCGRLRGIGGRGVSPVV